jgi:hypothetical protein
VLWVYRFLLWTCYVSGKHGGPLDLPPPTGERITPLQHFGAKSENLCFLTQNIIVETLPAGTYSYILSRWSSAKAL